MEIRIVNPAEWIVKVRYLLEANWAETGFDFPFNPSVEMYQAMADAGIAFALAAFDGGKVIGYCTVCVAKHPHNPDVIVGANDALFVAPEYRNGTATGRLIKAAEAEAQRRGAVRFTWHCRAGTGFADLLEKHGYTPVDVVVMRGLYGN